MSLIEREEMMALFQQNFEKVAGGEGHCILLSGEAGIGKTALVKEFCRQQQFTGNVFWGACDDLFTPRPLGPLFDVLWQINQKTRIDDTIGKSRHELFLDVFQKLSTKDGSSIVVFEDIHWADNGTLDFIQFMVRRIEQLSCLLILTFRENEINLKRSLRNMVGQLPPDAYTKLQLAALSKQAVFDLAASKGFNGNEVYEISGGNPFYVNEILASYSPGIPDKIKNAILSVFEQQKATVKNGWEIWSIMPDGLELELLPKVKKTTDLENCFALDIIRVQNGKVVFKHEIYRRTIEETLSPIKKVELNRKMIDLFLTDFERQKEFERILHYAKNANEKKLVVQYAPKAAQNAASIGAHKEAAKIWLTAIEFFDEGDSSRLATFYEAYANECFLSNQIKEAITYSEKAYLIWKDQSNNKRAILNLCLLSRLCYYYGTAQQAETFAMLAWDLQRETSVGSAYQSRVYSSIAMLKMHGGNIAESVALAETALKLANDSDNELALCEALNVFGMGQVMIQSAISSGIGMLQKGLRKALKNAASDHAAQAYLTIMSCAIAVKEYDLAESILPESISYTEEFGLTFWKAFLLAHKARLEFEKGNWSNAWETANNLRINEELPTVIRIPVLNVLNRISMRRGEDMYTDLQEAFRMSVETMEPQRLLPSITAMMEYEWLNRCKIIEEHYLEKIAVLAQNSGDAYEKHECFFWLWKSGRASDIHNEALKRDYEKSIVNSFITQQTYYPYEQALILYEGNAECKRTAITKIQNLGAVAVYEKMKQEMRGMGINNIPRGIRNATRSNAALLTTREMEILKLLKQKLQNKEIASQLFISAKTVDHHISSILFKLDTNSRYKAVAEAVQMGILK